MQLSKTTLEILKNFATINTGLIIKPGTTLRTMEKMKNIIAVAEVEENFPQECQIWDLAKFLQLVGAMGNPELEWQEKRVILTANKASLAYAYGIGVDPYPPSELKKRDTLAEFDLDAEDLKQLLRMTSLMDSATVSFNMVPDAASTAVVESTGGDNTNKFSLELAAEGVTKPHSISIAREDFRILPGDYRVTVTERFIKLVANDPNIWYLIVGVVNN